MSHCNAMGYLSSHVPSVEEGHNKAGAKESTNPDLVAKNLVLCGAFDVRWPGYGPQG